MSRLPESLSIEIIDLITNIEGDVPQIVSKNLVAGGCINRAMCIQTAESKYFLKYNQAGRFPNMFISEKEGLNLIAQTGRFRTPKVIGTGEDASQAWLLLENVEEGYIKTGFWENFGTSLAEMHRETESVFGLNHNNYIGSLPQSNRFHDSWSDFFIYERLEPLLALARETGLIDSKLNNQFSNLYKAIPSIFPSEPPSLVHGDLWNGNFLCDNNGKPCLIDPAVYYGFREMDIAMSLLFGGFDKCFYDAYNESFPLVSGWKYRVEICNVYPVLVHLNLFGKSYLAQLRATLEMF